MDAFGNPLNKACEISGGEWQSAEKSLPMYILLVNYLQDLTVLQAGLTCARLEIPTAAQWLGELPALQCCKAWPGVSRGGTMPEDVPEVDEAKTRVFLKLQVIL